MALATGQSDFQAVHKAVDGSFLPLCFKEENQLSLARKRVEKISETIAHTRIDYQWHRNDDCTPDGNIINNTNIR